MNDILLKSLTGYTMADLKTAMEEFMVLREELRRIPQLEGEIHNLRMRVDALQFMLTPVR